MTKINGSQPSNKLLLAYLIDTLRMLAPQANTSTADSANSILEEIEGDYYTFLHPDNLELLCDAGLLTKSHVDNCLIIRNSINNIRSNMWNSSAFCNATEWLEVRVMSTELLKKLDC